MSAPTDETYDALRFSVGRVLAADRRLRGRDQQRGTGTLGHSHLRALFVLTRENEATAGALARAAELNPASMTAMIDHLEAGGLVRRRRDEQDRRQTWISLTDAGREQVAAKERLWRSKMANGFSDITPDELAAASKVLDRIATVMESLSEDRVAAEGS